MPRVKVAGWIETSLVDVLGNASFSVWFSHCNFRCPWCQNGPVVLCRESREVEIGEILDSVKEHAWISDYLHVTGGEPTLQPHQLEELLRRVKSETELKTSISTNGSNPSVLSELLEKGLLDHVAIDVKAPLSDRELYARVIGLEEGSVVERVASSLSEILERCGFVEIRTTLVPGLLSVEDVERIAAYLANLRVGGDKRIAYVIQQFSPSETVLSEEFRRAPRTDLESVLKAAKRASEVLEWEVWARTLERGVIRVG